MADALGIQNYGAPDDEPDRTDLMAMFRDEEEGDTVEEPDQETVAVIDEEPETPLDPNAPVEPDAPETALDETPLDGETEQQTAERLYAGKYRSPEDMEKAYEQITVGFTRQAQENAAYRQAQEQLQSQLAEQGQYISQITQFLQAQMAENDPEFAEQFQQQQAMQQQVAQQIDQRVTPLEQRITTDQQGQQKMAAMQQAAAGFYQRHTDMVPGSPEDIAMTQGIVEMMNRGVPIDLANPEHLDVALEAARNDRLAAELMLSPQALQIPGGVDVLRQRAGATIAPPTGAPEGTPPAKQPARQRVEAFVETGSGGAPAKGAPGRTPDEFDDAWASFQERSAKGPLFGATRS